MSRLNRCLLCIFSLCVLGAPAAHAMMIMKIQQMKAMRERQAQQAQYQQYDAYQQGMAQGQQQAQAMNAEEAYQQQVNDRNQAIAQAIISAHNHSISQASAPVRYAQAGQSPAYAPAPPPSPAASSGLPSSQETVDLSEVWKKLDKSSEIWSAILDDKAKLLTVSEYIGRFQKEGVKINAPPAHYVQLLDQLAQQNPQMLEKPFGELIQILAIIDYDFDNGMDKDALAKAVLGPQGYEQNKKRFTQAQQPS